MFKRILIIIIILIMPFPTIANDGNAVNFCQAEGGIWKEFGSGCRGSCALRRFPSDITCTSALEYGCECGENSCWNDKTNKCEEITYWTELNSIWQWLNL